MIRHSLSADRSIRGLAQGCALVVVLACFAIFVPAARALTLSAVPAYKQGSAGQSASFNKSACAATSLAMICSYYGSPYTFPTIIQKLVSNKDVASDATVLQRNVGSVVGSTEGCNDVCYYAKNYSATAFNQRIIDQLNAGNPVEAWYFNSTSDQHHWVIAGYTGSAAAPGWIINDPATGARDEAIPARYRVDGYFAYSGAVGLAVKPASPRVVGTDSTTASLAWTDASGNENGFRVQYRVGSGAWVAAAQTAPANATSLKVTGLSPGLNYTFQVGAYNAAGTHWSVYFYGLTLPAQPQNPRPTAISQTSVSLAWDDVSSNETGFRVQYKTGSGAWTSAGPATGANMTSYKVTGLAVDTAYIFQVGASNSAGTKWSTYALIHTKPWLPAQPVSPKVTSTTASSAHVTWTDASNNETGFKFQYRVGTGAWVAVSPSAPANATSWTISGLASTTSYTFQVGAYNAAGTHWSAYFYGTTQKITLPAQPTSPSVTATTTTTATLAWGDASNNEDGFRVQYRVGTGAWVAAAQSASANATSLTVTGLGPNTPYTFQVGSYNAAGTHWSVYFYGTTQVDLSVYANHIVQWSGDTKTQKTAWYVTDDLRRLWVPDSATYYQLLADGAVGPDSPLVDHS